MSTHSDELLYSKRDNSDGRRGLNLCIGVCRSGTTAIAQIYGKAGFKSFYQPVKSDRRMVACSEQPNNVKRLLNAKSQHLFAKETIGPLRPYEFSIDYISIYAELGFDLTASNVIIAFRDPAATFGSWLRKWMSKASRDQLFRNYLAAEYELITLEEKACRLNIPITYFSHHLSGLGTEIFKTLFNRSKPQVPYNESYFWNWGLNNYADGAEVIFGSQPSATWMKEVHDTQSYFRGGEFFPPAEFSESERGELRNLRIKERYAIRMASASTDAESIFINFPNGG